jgi:DNA-binding GntR family transcriptional regulator
VHRNVVREAVIKLVDDGLVEVREGYYHVIRFDLHFINTTFTLRRALQKEALRQCATHLDREALEQLRLMWLEFNTHNIQLDRIETFFEADLNFHRWIGDLSKNRYLKQSLDRLLFVDLLIQRWSQHINAFSPSHIEYTVDGYLKILDALLSNNTLAAVGTLDTQLNRTHQNIGALVETQYAEVR